MKSAADWIRHDVSYPELATSLANDNFIIETAPKKAL